MRNNRRDQLCVTIALSILLACEKDRKIEAKPTPIIPVESEIMSAVIIEEDSTFSYDIKYKWPKAIKDAWKYSTSWDLPIDSEWVKSGPYIYIGIYEKHKIAPGLPDLSGIDSVIKEIGSGLEVVNRYTEERDSSSIRAVPLKLPYRFVYIDESLLTKPNFRIETLPKKYVSKYCRVGLSKPVYSKDTSLSIVYMFSPCMGGGRTYLLKKRGEEWSVIKKTILDHSYYGEPII